MFNLNRAYRDILIISGCFILYILLSSTIDSVFSAFLFFLIATTCLFLFYFSTSTQETRKLLLILTMAGIGFTFSEFIALLYYKSFVVNAPDLPRYSYDRTTYWVEDDELGYRPSPSKLVRARKEVNGQIIYDTEYTFDSNALRKTRSNPSAQCSFLFFGGSTVFGEGLPDTHTLPYQFSQKLNFNYQVLNFAFHGYGPHQMLRYLQIGFVNQLVSNKIAIVFYVFAPDDGLRAAGLTRDYRRGPKYIIQDGHPIYVGDLSGPGGALNSRTDFIQSGLSLLHSSQLFSLLYGFPEAGNIYYLDKNIELVTSIFTESQQIIQKKYNAKFIIILRNNSPVTQKIMDVLKDRGILVFDTSELLLQEWNTDYLIAGDNYPNEKANMEIAAGLANRFGYCQ